MKNYKKPTFDTDVLSAYKNRLTETDILDSVLSLVVFYEITATKIDVKKKRKWNSVLEQHFKKETLLIPTLEDWRESASLIWRMHRNKENVPLDATAFQNDALICQSAVSWHRENPRQRPPCFIVTRNVKHFELIAAYFNDALKRNEPKLVIVDAQNYFN